MGQKIFPQQLEGLIKPYFECLEGNNPWVFK
jgi:hypothetical protein